MIFRIDLNANYLYQITITYSIQSLSYILSVWISNNEWNFNIWRKWRYICRMNDTYACVLSKKKEINWNTPRVSSSVCSYSYLLFILFLSWADYTIEKKYIFGKININIYQKLRTCACSCKHYYRFIFLMTCMGIPINDACHCYYITHLVDSKTTPQSIRSFV